MTQMKHVVISIIFQCTELHKSKYNGSWILSIKLSMHLNIQPPAMFLFLVFRKSGITKNCLSIEDLSAYKISWSYIDWRKFRIHLSSLKFQLSPYSKDPSNKIIILTKLEGMSTILHIVRSFVCLTATIHDFSP
jgi:hypothetical protein